jgi:cytochrome c2
MTARCDACRKPVDGFGKVTRRYTLGSRRPGRIIAATCAACHTAQTSKEASPV